MIAALLMCWISAGLLFAQHDARFDAVLTFARKTSKNGGLIVQHKGRVIYERYFGLGHAEATPNLASCGKMFTSVAMGILLEERRDLFPSGLDEKVFAPRYLPDDAFPLSDSGKAEIRLGHLLAMSAGIRGNNPSYVRGREVTLDPAGPDGAAAMRDAVAFGKASDGARSAATLWCKPGGGYSYATSSIHLVSVILRHVTGMELEQFVREKIARPLQWGPWSFAYKNAELGHTPGGGGIALRARDMLKFGTMLLQKGRWRGTQVVPRRYVEHCAKASPYNPHYPYSLQFEVNSDGHVTDVPRDAFWKSGSGGHALYVVPSLDLVVWKLGGRDEQYAPANTGLPASPAVRDPSRDGFRASAEIGDGVRDLLQQVVRVVR